MGISENHIISWHVSDRNNNSFIKKEYHFGKYRFHEFGKDYFNLDQYKKENKIGFKDPHLSFCISWNVPPENELKIKETTKSELVKFLNLLSLETNRHYEFGQFDHYVSSKKISSHTNAIMCEDPVEVSADLLEQTVLKMEKIQKLSPSRQEIVERSIQWFGRGMKDFDKINRFINFWVGLEILSNWVDDAPSFQCPKCKFIIFPHSIKGRCKRFLELTKPTRNNFDELYGKRNGLFHNAVNVTSTDSEILKSILKESIIWCLNNP